MGLVGGFSHLRSVSSPSQSTLSLESRGFLGNKYSEPSIGVRLLLLILLVGFFRLDDNPIVRLEAILYLSPAPFERATGLKTVFSGMTEASYLLVHGNWYAAFMVNPFILPFYVFVVFALVIWRFPVIKSSRGELTALCIFFVTSCIVNFW